MIVPNGFLAREGGAAALERRWLRPWAADATVQDAEAWCRTPGSTTFAVAPDEADRPAVDIEGTTVVGERPLELVDVEFVLRSYQFQP